MREKDMQIISHLRNDARIALTEISKRTQIPTSTVFDRIKATEGHIIKHTTLLDFEKIGYNSRNMVIIKVMPEKKKPLKEYLISHPNVNNLYITNSNSDFLVETIFKNQKETNDFMEEIMGFTQEIRFHNIIEDLKRESFMSLR